MDILIPMCGKGERFSRAGFKDPKPLIDVLGKPLFFHVVDSLAIDWARDRVLVVYATRLDEHGFGRRVQAAYPHVRLLPIAGETLGAADTVFRGLSHLAHEEGQIGRASCRERVS
jgi:NDP-sugar pyrophosphorylase family protein